MSAPGNPNVAMVGAPHRWKPGESGNPGGRTRGFKGVAELIMRETRDGAELVEFALATMRNVGPGGAGTGNRSFDERWQAHNWLANYGIGRPIVSVDIAAALATGENAAAIVGARLVALTYEQRELLEQLDIVDAECVEGDAPPQLEQPSDAGEEHDAGG